MQAENGLTEEQKSILRKAQLDEQTGVLNRSTTMKRIDTFLKGRGKNGTHALVMLDIDNLKSINDTLGHQCGDEAIVRVAKDTKKRLRRNDIVGRVGGDEFFILLKDTNANDVSQKVSSLLAELQFTVTNGEKFLPISVSAGISMYDGSEEEPKTLTDLYSKADVALYTSKAAGKNTFFLNCDSILQDEGEALSKNNVRSLSLNSVLNNLATSISIFRGNNEGVFTPVFCNSAFLELFSITHESFLSEVSKDEHYGVHPDDLEEITNAFKEAYNDNVSKQCTLRLRTATGGYKWIHTTFNVRYLNDDEFDVYSVMTDADQTVREQRIIKERYNNHVERRNTAKTDALAYVRLNLTADNYETINRTDAFCYNILDGVTVNDYISSASKCIAYSKMGERFYKEFSREALLECFDKGEFSKAMKLPLRLKDGRILWCSSRVSVSENPLNGDVEAILSLHDTNRRQRMEASFERMMQNYFEFIGNINVKSGLITVISEINDDFLRPLEGGTTLYDSVSPERVRAIISEEFAQECERAIRLDTVVKKLEENKIYICTYPAKRGDGEHECAYQWRFCYVDDTKEDILISRTEVLGFLDKGQRVDKKNDSLIHAEGELTRVNAQRHSVLIADDADMNREMLKIIFEKDFNILEAADGEEAIRLIDTNYEDIAVILLDYKMPKKTGLDVLIHLKLRGLNNLIPVIMVTGSATNETSLQSLEYGISDIIYKPFDSKIVRRRALNLIELYAHKEDTEAQLEEWKQDAMKLHAQAEKNNELLINALSAVVEFRSLESGAHIKRVSTLSGIMLRTWTMMYPENHFSDLDIEEMELASTLHDIGKVGIPDNILEKPARLTPEEYEIMKTHTIIGCQIIERFKQTDSNFYRYCYDICRYHHERSDGRGYPDGLKEEEIPVWAQVVSVVDVFDALVSPRVYKKAISIDRAIEMIRGGECGVFSQKLLKCFEAAKDEMILTSKRLLAEEADSNKAKEEE